MTKEMDLLSSKLQNLIEFAESIDDLEKFSNGSSFLSVVIGTLRKDLAIAHDIQTLTNSQSSGLSTIALCRILIEDYIHLSYLINNEEERDVLLKNFNDHPSVDGYLLSLTLQDLGVEFTQIEIDTYAKIKLRFDKHKSPFLRFGSESKKINPDDYFRTWTKENLNSLIKKSGIIDDGQKNELRTLMQVYDTGSSVIHHNAFLIWNLSRVNLELVAETFPGMSLTLGVSTFAKILRIALAAKYENDDNTHLEKLNELNEII